MTEPNHISFKKKRQAYGITLNDISKESGLSMSTVGAYERFTSKYTETRVKDVNASKIENALNSIITERISNTFIGGKKMEETRTEEPGKVIVEKKFTANNLNPAYDRSLIAHKIRKYCEDSKIGIDEFCKMCGIWTASFTGKNVKDHPFIYGVTIRKICKATGWTVEMLTGPDDIQVKKPVTTATYDQKEYIPLVNVVKTSNVKLLSEGPVGKIFDEKLICQDGKSSANTNALIFVRKR